MFRLFVAGGFALVAHARLILISSSEPALLLREDGSCSRADMVFFGSFAQGRRLVFDAPTACTETIQADTSAYSVEDNSVIYSVVPAGVDPTLLDLGRSFEVEVDRVLQAANQHHLLIQNSDGVPSHSTQEVVRLIHSDVNGALLALAPGIDAIRRLDEALSTSPGLSLIELGPSVSHPEIGESSEKEASIEHLKAVLANLTFNGDVATVVSSISAKSIEADLTWLTGEAEGSPLWTRHSFSDGALLAADWLLQTFEREGGARCQLWYFRKGFSPNVICDFSPIRGTPQDAPLYLLGAHYDSRGSFGSTRAPGGDDDASGVSQLLAIARGLHENRVKLHAPLRLVAFSGEEQGLVGSRAYAAMLRKASTRITLMIQADMLGYHVPGEPMQLGLPVVYHTPIASLLVGNVSTLYAPELVVGPTKACCSDTQSFLENGYVATEMFERAGPIADPMYHSSGDVIGREGYDVEQIKAIVKVTFATILHAAGFTIG